jgi:polysaccharide export outer membrane protein
MKGSWSIRGSRHGSRRGAAVLIGLLAAFAAGAGHAQYRLGPGDRVTVSVLGAAELSRDVEIDVDGMVRLPVFGAVDAAGLTLEGFQTALRDNIAGKVFKRITGDGAPIFIGLEPDDVYASIATYRPVFVTGNIGRGGGAVAFQPGLTVRAALAAAGGMSPELAVGNPTVASPRLQGEERNLSFETARLVAEIWRLDAELAENPLPQPPTATPPVPRETFDALLANQQERLITNLSAVDERRRYFKAAVEQAEERLSILNQQRGNQVTAAEFDAEEQAQVETLFERGVVPISRLTETRRAQLLSSTRLLDTDNNIERVAFERIRLEGDAQLYEDQRRTALLADIEAARGRLETAAIRLNAVREELVLNGQAISEFAMTEQVAPVVTIHRGGRALADVGPDAPLEPGDVVEVYVEPFDPATALSIQ